MVDTAAIRERAEAIKSGLFERDEEGNVTRVVGVQGAVTATLSILTTIYGPSSAQIENFKNRIKRGAGENDHVHGRFEPRVARDITSILDTAIAELESGITGTIQVRAKGEVPGDFVALARNALDEQDENADRVAAVLTAGSLEATLKQIGVAAGLDVYDRDIKGVIQNLQDAGVLTGSQPSVARGFVPFRNKALHGQLDKLDKIDRATTQSALSFVQGLLSSGFS